MAGFQDEPKQFVAKIGIADVDVRSLDYSSSIEHAFHSFLSSLSHIYLAHRFGLLTVEISHYIFRSTSIRSGPISWDGL